MGLDEKVVLQLIDHIGWRLWRLARQWKQAFDAEEIHRSTMPDGTVNHAMVKIGDSMVMMGQAQADYPPMPCMLYLYVPDVDATVATAVAGGAKVVRPVENQFYGDRMGTIDDPFGHRWYVATHVEDVPPAEMAKRAADAMRKSS